MSSVNESVSRVREMLNYPLPNSPAPHRIYGALLRHIQNRFNELSNTGESWAYAEATISAVADTDEYTISATAFGKPLSVVSYSTDDAHFERPVPFYSIGNLVFDWDVPRNIADGYWSSDGSANSAERIAFYRSAGTNTVKVKIRPIPQASATYKVLYSVGDWTDDVALSATPLLSEYHAMFEIPAALSLLPSARWVEDEVTNQNHRTNLKEVLTGELMMFTPVWRKAIASQVNARLDFRPEFY